MAPYSEVRSLSPPEAAYLAGLIDGEGTVTLSRKHAGDMRQLVVSIRNTELPILEFALLSVGAGKLTNKCTSKANHSPSYVYAVWNRQALALLAQVEPYMRSYKAERARLVLRDYVRLTPRNGRYSEVMRIERTRFRRHLAGIAGGTEEKAPSALRLKGHIGGGGGTAGSASFETGWTMPSSCNRSRNCGSGACYPDRSLQILVPARAL
jgi:hypothetical protein